MNNNTINIVRPSNKFCLSPLFRAKKALFVCKYSYLFHNQPCFTPDY